MSVGKTITPGSALNPTLTLWRCTKCHSFFSIESLKPIQALKCLICEDSPLHFCGSVEPSSQTSSEDDTCGDYSFDGW
jgi:hypothetical protein